MTVDEGAIQSVSIRNSVDAFGPETWDLNISLWNRDGRLGS